MTSKRVFPWSLIRVVGPVKAPSKAAINAQLAMAGVFETAKPKTKPVTKAVRK